MWSTTIPTMTELSTPPPIRPMPVALAFGVIALVIGTDFVLDWRAGSDHVHLIGEATVTALAVGFGGWLAWRGVRARAALAGARERAAEAEAMRAAAEARAHALAAEAARWRAEAHQALAGLGEAIDLQLRRWNATAAESEVALLLLKGLSTKEIAAVRGVSDHTVRQQARSLYAKAGLSGRAELSAFFLEDLLLPRAAEGVGEV
jgi:DNA-binding CsgD family transcriptional regulator